MKTLTTIYHISYGVLIPFIVAFIFSCNASKVNTPEEIIVEKNNQIHQTLESSKWVVTHVFGSAIPMSNNVPNMSLSLAKKEVYGTDGCNQYFGSIDMLSEAEIKFGPMASTKMLCQNMETPDKFNKALEASVGYQLGSTTLVFLTKTKKNLFALLNKNKR